MSTKNCNPLNSVYCNLKIKLAGNLSEKDLAGLYSCTLCNDCHTADFNRGAREMAVSRSLVAPHVSTIGRNIREKGNPYGISGNRAGSGKCDTILFRGCTPTYKAPEILAAVESLLGKKGVQYGLIDNETCCGNVLFNLGDKASGAEVVRANIAKFKAAGVKKIITVCPGCYTSFNKYYKGQDGFNPEVVLAVDLLSGFTLAGDFAIQDPCHGKEKSEVVRSLLPGSANKSVSPCCGAGSGVMTHDRLLASSKAEKAVGASQSKIVTYCPFCYLSLSAARPEKVSDIYVMLDKHARPSAPAHE
ncbi:predicted Fe-S cluster-binding oxidoreductase [Methanocella arvoryzae MRE50]|uniref:Predicted Fe-S cluster-binding oxidoreductase n=2 Tax=Methanocella TaxID=570266 RepID=Q0W641_METAR|nr:predicted Fe-S cluster-binding oxidoreductase [Methanocella arvoryzae MRE50]